MRSFVFLQLYLICVHTSYTQICTESIGQWFIIDIFDLLLKIECFSTKKKRQTSIYTRYSIRYIMLLYHLYNIYNILKGMSSIKIRYMIYKYKIYYIYWIYMYILSIISSSIHIIVILSNYKIYIIPVSFVCKIYELFVSSI